MPLEPSAPQGKKRVGSPLVAKMAESFWMGAVEPEEIVSEGEPPPPQPASRVRDMAPARTRVRDFRMFIFKFILSFFL